MDNHLFQLLHLADSALPVGGYAYSNGLEYAVKSGMIASVSDLERHLNEFIKQLISYDLTFVKAAYKSDTSKLNDISEYYNVSLLNPLLKKAGITLGKNWAKVIESFGYKLDFPEELDFDFPIVYGVSSAKMGIELNDCLNLFVFMTIRDQISAVIRLGTLGPGTAHIIQHNILKSNNVSEADILNYDEAYKTAFLLENYQLLHTTLYTRLFQN